MTSSISELHRVIIHNFHLLQRFMWIMWGKKRNKILSMIVTYGNCFKMFSKIHTFYFLVHHISDLSISLEYWNTFPRLKICDSFYYCQHSLSKTGNILCHAICAIWTTSTFHSWCSAVKAILYVWLTECIRETNKPRQHKKERNIPKKFFIVCFVSCMYCNI